MCLSTLLKSVTRVTLKFPPMCHQGWPLFMKSLGKHDLNSKDSGPGSQESWVWILLCWCRNNSQLVTWHSHGQIQVLLAAILIGWNLIIGDFVTQKVPDWKSGQPNQLGVVTWFSGPSMLAAHLGTPNLHLWLNTNDSWSKAGLSQSALSLGTEVWCVACWPLDTRIDAESVSGPSGTHNPGLWPPNILLLDPRI